MSIRPTTRYARAPPVAAYRLAIDHPLRALAVTGSFHRDLGCGPLNFAEILFAEFDRCCREVLLQPMSFRRPWNGHDPRLLSKNPGKCDLSRGRLLRLSDCL